MPKGLLNNLQRIKDLDHFKKLIARYKTADFDGHTDFMKLSSEQRLCWLSCCANFTDQIKQENTDGR